MRLLKKLCGALAIGASLIVAAGCTQIKNPGLKESALGVPEARRAHVYAIFLNSQNDPLGVTNFRSVQKFAVECGFANARYHHFSGGSQVADEVREILKNDREAKICLIGWSGASLYAFDATAMVQADGITIDEIVYLDSNWIKERRLNETPHPRNVGRVALLYSEHRTPPRDVPNPVVYEIPVEGHLDSASNPRTAEIIVSELIGLANRTPANRR